MPKRTENKTRPNKARINYKKVQDYLYNGAHKLQIGFDLYRVSCGGDYSRRMGGTIITRSELTKMFDGVLDYATSFDEFWSDNKIDNISISDVLFLLTRYAYQSTYSTGSYLSKKTDTMIYNTQSRRIQEQINHMYSMVNRISKERLMSLKESIALLTTWLCPPYDEHTKSGWERHMNNMADTILQ